ncbi:MAG: prepilin-type N-terminal cleavage/methylation domain-containing protein [Candidatus Liptonbacteria bacterium]|nr:prepilin-type N-terminal cleavage/methylation domain-containing protein [Candidatus Liptonbacteria bacterium]
MKKGFTLVELFIVVGILVTIVAIVFLILNPVEYLRRARDAQRLRDYALINQAVNFYSYNTSVGASALDWDGPNYTESCKDESDQKIFVSVPSDSGEGSPTPPDGWTYTRANSAAFRGVSGLGWLPIDFTNTGGGGIQPLNILPVDPTNTFESGFYYTYTCGSYELNLRFESDKYRTLAQNDGGGENDVYEIGNDLTAAPYQNAYRPTSTNQEEAATGTIVIYPTAAGYYTQWAGGSIDIDDSKETTNDSDYIHATNANFASTFVLTDTSQTGTISKVRLVVRASKSLPTYSWSILPRLRSTASMTNNNGSSQSLTSTWTSYTYTYTTNPFTGSAWNWSDINDLQAGVVIATANTSGRAQVSQIYLEVDYQN